MMASLLGWGGVIPFAAAALAWLYGEPIHRIYALQLGTIYAGTIVVFLGAVHWGLAISNEGKRNAWLVWSILPSLAVTLVLFLPAPVRPLPMLAGLLICWGVDRFALALGLIPGWYMRLRHGLTIAAGLSMATLAFT